MSNLWKSAFRMGGAVAATALFAFAQGGSTQPGAVNYVEGAVTLNGQNLTAKSVGSVQVEPGQILQTGQGKAEVLLTPGIFVRLDDNSALAMTSNSLTNTAIQLQRGRALMEVDLIEKENHVVVAENGATVQVEKKGVYQLDANTPSVQVFDGKLAVTVNDRTIDLGKGKQLVIASGAKLKPQSFDTHQGGELYAWSKLRSEYMAEANLSSARTIVVNNPGWYGTGWYWNPWFDSWAFVPGAGYFYNPFGFGFYSPAFYAYSYPGFYGFRGGYGIRPGHVGYGYGFRGGVRAATPAPAFRSAGGFAAAHSAGFAGGHFGGRR
ncbi:MAG: FecR domain-containing protein [Acidobacteriia bacterium]|nr:FecR domain-containing protein [Terriglobia bacterium]